MLNRLTAAFTAIAAALALLALDPAPTASAANMCVPPPVYISQNVAVGSKAVATFLSASGAIEGSFNSDAGGGSASNRGTFAAPVFRGGTKVEVWVINRGLSAANPMKGWAFVLRVC